MTQFSDLTDEEFETQHMGGYKKTPGLTAATKSLAAPAAMAVASSPVLAKAKAVEAGLVVDG